MDYVLLGKTGVRVSPLCLGTMTFGKEADEETSRSLMDRAFDQGINFFDTANIYNGGLTEEIIGRWLPAHRDAIVLASKVHFPTGEGPNERGSSRRHILRAVEKSLARLQTDHLDLLYLHHWDCATDLEETFAALTTLVQQGKILYVGVSNFAAWQTMKALWVADVRHLVAPVAIQPMYNLLKRQVEVEILPMAQDQGLAIFPYNPLAAGLLTGKYQRGEKGRMDENEMYRRRYSDPIYMEVSDQFVSYARDHGWSTAALAVAWVNAHPAVTASIIGARNKEQLDDTLGCLEIQLDREHYEVISTLAPQPPLATDRERN